MYGGSEMELGMWNMFMSRRGVNSFSNKEVILRSPALRIEACDGQPYH